MGSAQVQQLQGLSALFRRALDICAPDSVAVLGIAGGDEIGFLDVDCQWKWRELAPRLIAFLNSHSSQ